MPFMAIGRAGLLLSLFVYMMSLVGTSVFSGSLRQHCVYSVLPEVKYTARSLALRGQDADKRRGHSVARLQTFIAEPIGRGLRNVTRLPAECPWNGSTGAAALAQCAQLCAQSRLCWMGA